MHTQYALASAALPVAGKPGKTTLMGWFHLQGWGSRSWGLRFLFWVLLMPVTIGTCSSCSPLVDIAQDVRTKDTPTMGHICSYLWKPIWSQHFELMPFNALMTSSSSLFCGKEMLTVMANSEVAVLLQASWCIFHWETPCPGPSRCGGAKCEPSKNPFLQHSKNYD